jgi:hypothetical protein
VTDCTTLWESQTSQAPYQRVTSRPKSVDMTCSRSGRAGDRQHLGGSHPDLEPFDRRAAGAEAGAAVFGAAAARVGSSCAVGPLDRVARPVAREVGVGDRAG